jgi:N-methylhydantoinase B
VLSDNGTVAEAATKKLRAKLIKDGVDMGLFNFGGTIEELLARAQEETHLPAPQRPNA